MYNTTGSITFELSWTSRPAATTVLPTTHGTCVMCTMSSRPAELVEYHIIFTQSITRDLKGASLGDCGGRIRIHNIIRSPTKLALSWKQIFNNVDI